MVNLRSETPYFYWTLDRIGDLEQGQTQHGFDGSVWKADVIRSYDIGESQVIFDSPAVWATGLPPAKLHRNPEGRYEHRSEGVVYDAVRADTRNHIVLTGTWTETDFGKGVFIAVLPVKEGLEVLLETTAAVPLESQLPQLVSRP